MEKPEVKPGAPPPPPAYAPPARETARKKEGPFGLIGRESRLTSVGITLFVVIGVVIFFVGAIICNASVMTEVRSYGEEEEWEENVEDARFAYKVGTVVATVGALVACVGLFMGALGSTKFDLALRVAMLSVATAIIIVTLVIMLLGGVFGRTTALL